MSLIQCNMCKKDISPNASSCPHCGEPRHSVSEKEKISTYRVVIKESSNAMNVRNILIHECGFDLKTAFNMMNNMPLVIPLNYTFEQANKLACSLKKYADTEVKAVTLDEIKMTPSSNFNNHGITCPKCKQNVIPIKPAFNFILFLILCLLWIFPAVIYLIYWATKQANTCPFCKNKLY